MCRIKCASSKKVGYTTVNFKMTYAYVVLDVQNFSENVFREVAVTHLYANTLTGYFIWKCGKNNYDEIENDLKDLLRDVKYVYVKGAEKIFWVQKYTTANIINLEPLGCEFLNKMSACDNHSFDSECAASNVFAIKHWIESTDVKLPKPSIDVVG